MLPITGWELVYTDGSVVTDSQTSWAKAPATGVQVMVLLHAPPYADLTYGVDSYLLPGQPARTAKAGAWMADEQAFMALVRSTANRVQGRR